MLLCRRPRIFDVDVVGLAGVVLVAALTWLAVVGPLDGRRRAACEGQEETASEIAELEGERDRLRDAVAQRRSLAASLEQTQDVLERSRGMAGVVHSLQELAGEVGVELEEVSPGEGEEAARYRRTPARLVLTGSFVEVCEYLQRSRRALPYVWPRALAIDVRGGAAAGGGGCEVALDVDVFSPVELAVGAWQGR